ncbi:NAD(P)-dependent oxidoreductase [Sulfurimicrobium lacus]|uniref:dTDP-4-dehydrorhamnose reductase n=1 Tax=Sulfurimicrobium lacus TaxID=2715678 RepID=A0A6F8VIG9_9PROT|nr:dTDP-4-dehydrorhamnose reductase [Sulfurimicrobium lacus]BCB28732.1 NAD(P)-dependent oxidoreductase [Sulfurimicrobium lacus]
MKILLTGKNGQVGWELQRALGPLGQVVAVDRQVLDLGNPDSIRAVIREVRPDLIVNPAAYTAVDKAESEPELAMAVNGIAPGIMAEEAKKLGAAMIHYSTDYVFDGRKTSPYTEEDIPSPLNVYGKTKLAGEQAVQAAGIPHLILRTSWVYGARGKNFLLTILRLAKEREELKIVADQIGAPTWSRMIAEATAQILAQSVSPLTPHPSLLTGVYNLTAAGRTSWCGFTQAIVENAQAGTRVMPIPTSDYPLPAPRPLFSLLASDKLARTFGVALPLWDESLKLCMA